MIQTEAPHSFIELKSSSQNAQCFLVHFEILQFGVNGRKVHINNFISSLFIKHVQHFVEVNFLLRSLCQLGALCLRNDLVVCEHCGWINLDLMVTFSMLGEVEILDVLESLEGTDLERDVLALESLG